MGRGDKRGKKREKVKKRRTRGRRRKRMKRKKIEEEKEEAKSGKRKMHDKNEIKVLCEKLEEEKLYNDPRVTELRFKERGIKERIREQEKKIVMIKKTI